MKKHLQDNLGTCTVSVDVDGLSHYHRIHGLPEAQAGDQAWTCGVRRFLDLFERHDAKGTFFVIAEDIIEPGPARDLVVEAAARGHEIANHSLHHRYDLVHLGQDERQREIEEGAAVIAKLTGSPPLGFRAPGYTVDAELLRQVRATGHRYDSSVFPSPPYYLAKWSVMLGMRMLGRRSESIFGSPRCVLAPTQPYYPGDNPYAPNRETPSKDALLEIPIAVTPYARIPVIGTFLLLLGASWFRRNFARLASRNPVLNLECHAIDLMGLEEDGLDPALAAQPDLRHRSLQQKLDIFDEALTLIRGAYSLEPLASVLESADGREGSA